MTTEDSERYVWVAVACGQTFPLRNDELPGYLAGVAVMLFCCGLVALIEIPLLLYM